MKAISPIVSMIMVFLLVIFSITITLTVIKPAIDRIIDSSNIQEAISNLNLLNSIINDISTEAIGSKRTFFISISDGEIVFDKSTQTISYIYRKRGDLELKGSVGNILLDSGSVVFEDFFNSNKGWICRGSCFIENNALKVNGTAYFPLRRSLTNSILTGSVKGSGIGTFVTNPESLVLWLTFDEGSGTVVRDYSGYNNHGTIYGHFPHIQINSTVLQLNASSPINLTHIINIPNITITSDVNLTIRYRNNTIGTENIRVFINRNYIGNFTTVASTTEQHFNFTNILRTNFTIGINNITYEGNRTNITRSEIIFTHPIGWVDGTYGKALSFDGTDDYIDIGSSTSLTFQHEFSVFLWIYPVNGTHRGGGGSIVPDWRESALIDRHWGKPIMLSIGDSLGRLTTWLFRTDSNMEAKTTSTLRVSDRVWQMVGYVVDLNTKKLRIYKNMEYEEFSLAYGTEKPLAHAGTLQLARFPDASWQFLGYEDEVRIYNRSLTDEEIKFLYLEGLNRIREKYGEIEFESKIPNASIFLSSPQDFSTFDSIRVITTGKTAKLTLPLEKAEIINNLRIGKGNVEIEIKKIGYNLTTRKSIIEVKLP
ncbi:MAG: LamG-like jellyroll fold domain-containing protein [Candidatus Aenigmarchaeota archaeon]|nr:LamG domain-containing protein [Candidatus Aenigmarchaeota archaeon]MDW8149507.1 LamG-like jellyroll fold domain-containing protein [Candidatus Aenigmarchaeota archaeon]